MQRMNYSLFLISYLSLEAAPFLIILFRFQFDCKAPRWTVLFAVSIGLNIAGCTSSLSYFPPLVFILCSLFSSLFRQLRRLHSLQHAVACNLTHRIEPLIRTRVHYSQDTRAKKESKQIPNLSDGGGVGCSQLSRVANDHYSSGAPSIL